MKVRVHVSLKASVLDPQGQAIHHALQSLGHSDILSVRQGKYFDIEVDHAVEQATLVAQMQAIGQDVLSNPVIEDFQIEILET